MKKYIWQASLHEDLEHFMEDVEKSTDKFDLRKGFYSESDDALPRHHVDEDDLRRESFY